MKKCSCGQKLPLHLAELSSTMQHTCSCRRVYKANKKGEFDLVAEHGPNPFADFDEAQAAKVKT